MSSLFIGIDLGGTNIVAAVVDADGKILARHKVKTSPQAELESTAGVMRQTAENALAQTGREWEQVSRVGIAVPASIDPDTGDLLHAPNLGWQNQPARATFTRVFGREVCLENDVNCGTLAEYKVGAAAGCRTVVGLFVGTGLGGGLIVNGVLHTGVRGVAGEIGHHIIRVGGRRCGCGHRGCLEAYCSKTAFGRRFEKLILRKGRKSVLQDYVGDNFANVRSKYLAKAYAAGDKVCCEVLNEGAYMLGVACANIMAVLAPDCIVLGGGVMEALGSQLLPNVEKGMADHLFGIEPADVSLRLSALGDDAVPLGAALLARAD
jgi:glucokinase